MFWRRARPRRHELRGGLTFFLHHKLPYKRMPALTGVLLGVRARRDGRRLRTHCSRSAGSPPRPRPRPADWWARWFEVVPTYELIAIQALAAVFVVGSYYAAEYVRVKRPRRRQPARPDPGGQRAPELPPDTPAPSPEGRSREPVA